MKLPIAALPQTTTVDHAVEHATQALDHVSHRFGEGEFAVGWGTLALINAGIAQGKNRSGIGWFLLSLFFGPLATFILVILDKQPYYEED